MASDAEFVRSSYNGPVDGADDLHSGQAYRECSKRSPISNRDLFHLTGVRGEQARANRNSFEPA